MRFLLVFAFWGSFLTASHAGGPWPLKKGQGYYKLSEWWVRHDQHFDTGANLIPHKRAWYYRSALYGEVGVAKGWSLLVNVPFYINTGRITGEQIGGFGDVDVGIKYGFSTSKIPLAISFSMGIPSSRTEDISGVLLQTGDGEFNQILRADIGKSFSIKGRQAYIASYLGFNHRTEGYSDEVLAGLEFGMAFLKNNLWIIYKSNIVESLKNGEKMPGNFATSFYSNNQEYFSYDLEASYFVDKHWGITVGSAGSFRGEAIPARRSYTIGVFIKY